MYYTGCAKKTQGEIEEKSKKIEEKSKKSTPDIIPGYYSNKQHWNSVKPDGDVPDELLKKLLNRSYDLVFKNLTKKKQKEILEGGVSARPDE